MRILGIETSCDETAAAVAEGDLNSKRPLRLISSVVASSADLQAKYGGIVPEQAARQQLKAMIPTLWECLIKISPKSEIPNSKQSFREIQRHGEGIDVIAITVGPGLVGSLLVGVETARTLAYLWQKPIIPVNHLVAHLYANWIETENSLGSSLRGKTGILPEFPAIGLVVSGGHTDMVFMKDHRRLKLVGSTRDDAAGECFDKSARLLGLPYPGGPEIAKLAEEWRDKNHKLQSTKVKLNLFPRPLSDQENFDWSFSGLKTAVLRETRKVQAERGEGWTKDVPRLAAEVQEAICDSLIIKLQRAIVKFKPKSVLVAGGVAANKRLVEKLIQLNKGALWSLMVPPPKLCTDNGGYIAASAFYRYHPSHWRKVKVDAGLTITTSV